jgi:probable RNA-binding protein EIF1AD
LNGAKPARHGQRMRKKIPRSVRLAFRISAPLQKLPSISKSRRQKPTKSAMPRPKRNLLAAVEDTLTPPSVLPPSQIIARVTKLAGKNLVNAETAEGKPLLVELEAKFRSTIWIKRGSYVVVDTQALADRDNKLDGEIVNVVRDEKEWRKMSYW